MDSLFYERLCSIVPEDGSTPCVIRKPLPHKPSPLLTGCCQFNLKLHTVQYNQIHRGVRVTCPQRWIKRNFRTVTDSSLLAHWKPFVKGLFNKLIPTVYAKEEVGNKPSEELEFDHELFDAGEQPVEMLADEILRNETGLDRLKEMFGRYEGAGPEVMSPEIMNIVGVVFNTSVVTLLFGYYLGHNKCAQEFAEKHYHTKWQTKFKAARAYRDAVFLEGMKFGAKLAGRTALFVGIWLVVSTSISVYRNKTSFVEHVVAGGTAGAVYGLNMGLRGIFARGTIGATFGFVSGLILYFGFTNMNDTQEQRRYWLIVSRLQESRNIQRMVEED